MSSKGPRGDLLPIPPQAPSNDPPPPSAVEAVNLEIREIPLDLLEEVSKLSPPNNPVSPPMSTADILEPANMAATDIVKATMDTVNLNDLQDLGLRFKEPIGGCSVMDDMSQLQLQLQLQAAAKVATAHQDSLPSNVFTRSPNIGAPDVHQVGLANVQPPHSSNHAQLQLQLELRDLIASGFGSPSRQSPIEARTIVEPQEGPSGGQLKVNLNLTPRPESEPANIRLRPNQTEERTE